MSGLIAIRSSKIVAENDIAFLTDTINLSGNLELLSSITTKYFFATTSLRNAPLKGSRIHENSTWMILFAGDLVDHESIPFLEIIHALETDAEKRFNNFEGIFSIVAYHKVDDILYAISDRRSQQPLYYFTDRDGIYVGTDLSTFCRLGKDVQFNKEWLWQSLFFNFPVDGTTFLKAIKRLPPASVARYDCSRRKLKLTSYAEPFEKRIPLLEGQNALRRATQVFAERIPRYFEGADQIACALTGGWDGRTMLALSASTKDITSYTYGCPGCEDIVGAKHTSRLAHVDHISIPFGESFVSQLPYHMYETVYLSSGLQGILRATLHYAYDKLTRAGRLFPLTISGISLDMQFRGHAALPSLISNEMAIRFRGGNKLMEGDHWSRMIGTDFNEFKQTIQSRLDDLICRFGPFENAEHHLSYILYILSTEYFSGELKISDHFTTVRVPSWDSAIIELAYSIEQSTLSYSQFLKGHQRGSREELVLQAYLIKELAPHFFSIPAGNSRPSVVLAGTIPYQAYRVANGLVNRLRNKLFPRAAAPLEDWGVWLYQHNQAFLNELLFSRNSLIRQYVTEDFLKLSVAKRDKHFIGKFLTVEIILRLINNRWKRFW